MFLALKMRIHAQFMELGEFLFNFIQRVGYYSPKWGAYLVAVLI